MKLTPEIKHARAVAGAKAKWLRANTKELRHEATARAREAALSKFASVEERSAFFSRIAKMRKSAGQV